MKSNENITFYKQNFISRSMTTDNSIDNEVDSNEQNFDDTTDMQINMEVDSNEQNFEKLKRG